jgi:hypothetical protein
VLRAPQATIPQLVCVADVALHSPATCRALRADLRKFFTHDRTRFAMFAGIAYVQGGGAWAEAVPVTRRGLRLPHSWDQWGCVEALNAGSSVARELMRDLLAHLTDANGVFAARILRILARIPRAASHTVPALLRWGFAIHQHDAAFVEAFERLGTEAESAIPALLLALGNEEMRGQALRALAVVGRCTVVRGIE